MGEMMSQGKTLTGIERELVLQYLIDGNVPVTISTIRSNEAIEKQDFELVPMNSAVFPVALKAENVSVLKEGIILLKNPPKSVSNFIGQKVRVEFYFNRVGLFFVTQLKAVKSGPAIVIPTEIQRVEDVVQENKYDLTAKLILSDSENPDSYLDCLPADGFKLLVRPAWSSIPLENQALAKKYLEVFVDVAKKNGKAGNGIQLINICRYLVEQNVRSVQSVQGRVRPFDILFLNHERIVLGFEKNESYGLKEGFESQILISFVLLENHFINRQIKVSLKVDVLYSDEKKEKFAADCSFFCLQEEDTRFLYERATRKLFV